MPAATEPRMSLEVLKRTKEWNACTPKQRFWLETFVESNGDALLATQNAYGFKNELYAQQFTHQVQGNVHVRAVLNLLSGRSERDEFLDALSKKLLKKLRSKADLTVADKEAIQHLFAGRGWKVPEGVRDELRTNGYKPAQRTESNSAPQPFKVGDLIPQNGIDYEVLAVNSDGKVTSVRNTQTGEIENAV